MDTDLQRTLASQAGMADEYDHHLGMVENPLPFSLWRLKTQTLNSYLNRDPDGKNRSLDRPINNLCQELGV